MGFIQPWHIIVVVVVALIIFGPQRLPEIGRGLGKALNEFRKGTKEMTEGFREEVVRPVETTPSAPVAPVAPSVPVAPPAQAEPHTRGNFCTQCNKCGAQLPA
jgi:sec-independent protein translocase protein TatA